jgi:hypothetical protein
MLRAAHVQHAARDEAAMMPLYLVGLLPYPRVY